MEKAEALGEELDTALCYHPQWYTHTGQTPVHSKSPPKPQSQETQFLGIKGLKCGPGHAGGILGHYCTAVLLCSCLCLGTVTPKADRQSLLKKRCLSGIG